MGSVGSEFPEGVSGAGPTQVPHALPACRVGGPHAPHVVCDRPEPSLPCGRGPVKGIGEEQVGPRGSLCFGQHISPPRAVSSLCGAVFLCLCLYQMDMVASPGAWAGTALSWLQMALYPTPTPGLGFSGQASPCCPVLSSPSGYKQSSSLGTDQPWTQSWAVLPHGCLRWAWLQPKPSPVLTHSSPPCHLLIQGFDCETHEPFSQEGPVYRVGFRSLGAVLLVLASDS